MPATDETRGLLGRGPPRRRVEARRARPPRPHLRPAATARSLFRRPRILPRLEISVPADRHLQQFDLVAERVEDAAASKSGKRHIADDDVAGLHERCTHSARSSTINPGARSVPGENPDQRPNGPSGQQSQTSSRRALVAPAAWVAPRSPIIPCKALASTSRQAGNDS